jgi:HPt (histidine-containing phosphotransfer) domain-containing protein
MMREAGIGETADRILVVFLEDAPGRMADLETALRQQDGSAIRMAAHVFKSAAATIRAETLAQLLGRIEAAAESGDLDGATELLPRVRAEVDSVQSFLEPLQHPD